MSVFIGELWKEVNGGKVEFGNGQSECNIVETQDCAHKVNCPTPIMTQSVAKKGHVPPNRRGVEGRCDEQDGCGDGDDDDGR